MNSWKMKDARGTKLKLIFQISLTLSLPVIFFLRIGVNFSTVYNDTLVAKRLTILVICDTSKAFDCVGQDFLKFN